MLKKIIVLAACSLSINCYAELDFDEKLLEAEVVDNNYKIINTDSFDEVMRLITNNVNSYAPFKIGNNKTFDSGLFTRFGIFMNYTVNGLSKNDSEADRLKAVLLKNLCEEEFFHSKVARAEKIPFSIRIYNESREKIVDQNFQAKDCDQ